MKKNNSELDFEILRKLHKNPDFSQRDLAEKLGFSLGKLNYCLRAQREGFCKIKNFRKSSNKISHIQYVLTPKVSAKELS